MEILVDMDHHLRLTAPRRQWTSEIAVAHVRETMWLARDSVHIFYGRLDLLGKERWKYEELPKEEESTETQPMPASIANLLMPHLQPQPFVEAPRKWLISAWFDV